MRVPGSVLRGLKMGLGGTTLLVAVGVASGCSKAPAPTQDPQPAARDDKPESSDSKWSDDKASTDDKASKSEKWRDRSTDSTRDADRQARVDDRQVPGNSWFLSNPQDPSSQGQSQQASLNPAPQPVEQPRPVVVNTPPKPQTPRPGHWGGVRAACGRG